MIIQGRSIFKKMNNIEYFDFEEDFVEMNVRCIPMIVRFKMDAVGIKLKLSEWSLFSISERLELATMHCESEFQINYYHFYLSALVKKYTGNDVTMLAIEKNPAWKKNDDVPAMLNEKAGEFNWNINTGQWQNLSFLQRFALLKLCRPGHENKNFPKAMKEFNLTSKK